jgi:hypothetical protein
VLVHRAEEKWPGQCLILPARGIAVSLACVGTLDRGDVARPMSDIAGARIAVSLACVDTSGRGEVAGQLCSVTTCLSLTSEHNGLQRVSDNYPRVAHGRDVCRRREVFVWCKKFIGGLAAIVIIQRNIRKFRNQ